MNLSEGTIDVILWLLRANGVDGVPSVRQLKTISTNLRDSCGVHSNRYIGAFGHPYHVVALAPLIALVTEISSLCGKIISIFF